MVSALKLYSGLSGLDSMSVSWSKQLSDFHLPLSTQVCKIGTGKLTYKSEMSSTETFHVIYQTRKTAIHRDIQTPRKEMKIGRAANSRCLDRRLNTVSSA